MNIKKHTNENKRKRIKQLTLISVLCVITFLATNIAIAISADGDTYITESEVSSNDESQSEKYQQVYLSPLFLEESSPDKILEEFSSKQSDEFEETSGSSISDESQKDTKEDTANKEKESRITVKDIEWKTGYTTTSVNVRKKPNTESKVLDTTAFNQKIKYSKYNKKWYYYKLGKKVAYISKQYVSKSKCEYRSIRVWSKGFKSYMPYTAITSTSSVQYKLQHAYAYTGTFGIRQVDGRYCVAVGSAATSKIGVYLDLVLENGTIIPCILADQKANRDTGSDNLTTYANGCVSEFVVDLGALNRNAKSHGDISYCQSDWNSPVCEIRVYEKGIY